jgi:sulfate/thiosulfate transport system substrate-binding protein
VTTNEPGGRSGRSPRGIALLAIPAVLALSLSACGGNGTNTAAAGTGGADGGGSCKTDAPVLTLAAYSNPYDAYGKLTSTFATDYKDKTGKTLIFSMSFGGSTTQATNIVNGFPADVYASSLVPDVQLVQNAGLITNDWQAAPDKSIVATSVVGFMVRPGSNIKDWADLVKPGVQILTPDPAQSGGAKWNIVAAYGAVMRGQVPGYPATAAGAEKYLTDLFKNVTVLDKSANDSFKNFESGNGDVALTYENQALAGIAAGSQDKFVIPPSTVSIQTPTVVVDKNATDHCVEDLANQFVKYLHTPDAQAVFQTTGYQRPIDVKKAAKGSGSEYPPIKDLFTTDDLGGWEALASKTVFGPDGAFTKAFKAAKG